MNPDPHTPPLKQLLVYIGTYTHGDGQGIYSCQLDLSTGELKHLAVAGRVDNPSYLAVDAAQGRLFAVNELSEFGGRPGGGVSAFSIEPTSGQLTLINQVSSLGGAPCYITLDHTRRYVLLVNYTGGNVVTIPVDEDGALGTPASSVVHTGGSQHHERQDNPHPHSIVLDQTNRYALVPDLGLDRIMQYQFDPKSGRLLAHHEPWTRTPPGAGPRHMVFHPGGDTAYVLGELDSSIGTYAYDHLHGTLEPRQTVSLLPEDYSGPNLAADIHLTPDGRYLYASNRGHDSIAAYVVDETTGYLTHLGFTPTQGKSPRGFGIDPTGTYLLVANQDSDTILSFMIDPEDGTLHPTGYALDVPSPVCLKFVSLAS